MIVHAPLVIFGWTVEEEGESVELAVLDTPLVGVVKAASVIVTCGVRAALYASISAALGVPGVIVITGVPSGVVVGDAVGVGLGVVVGLGYGVTVGLGYGVAVGRGEVDAVGVGEGTAVGAATGVLATVGCGCTVCA